MLVASWMVLVQVAGASQEVADLVELVAKVRERTSVPALAAAVFFGDELEAIGVVGVRSRDVGRESAEGEGREPALVTGNDRWHIGSCGKAMTATMVASLVEEREELDWGTSVADVWGGDGVQLDPVWNEVTLERLLCHRAGLGRELPFRMRRELDAGEGGPRAQRERYVERVLVEFVPEEPDMIGEQYVYSNVGFVLAGAIAERVADRDYETLMSERLFAPLGMTHTGFGAPGVPGGADEPRGHKEIFGGLAPVEPGTRADNPRFHAPAGTIHLTLRDWGRFAGLHLAAMRGEPRLLEAATWERLHAPLAPDQTYAFGWVHRRLPGGEGGEGGEPGGLQLGHAGTNTMWYALVGLRAGADCAVIATTNVGGELGERACRETLAALEVWVDERLAERELESGEPGDD